MVLAAQDPGGAGKRGQFLCSTYGDPMEYLWSAYGATRVQHARKPYATRVQRAFLTRASSSAFFLLHSAFTERNSLSAFAFLRCRPQYGTITPMLVFALTIFTGAFLLFQVQPLIAKFILPWFGGGPGVWTTCMLFFQVLLDRKSTRLN